MSYVAPGENPTTIVICCASAEEQTRAAAVRMIATVTFFMRTSLVANILSRFQARTQTFSNSDLHLSAFVSARRYRFSIGGGNPSCPSLRVAYGRALPYHSLSLTLRARRFCHEETHVGKHSAIPRSAGTRRLRRGP